MSRGRAIYLLVIGVLAGNVTQSALQAFGGWGWQYIVACLFFGFWFMSTAEKGIKK